MTHYDGKYIVVTGAAGFIGSCLVAGFNQQGQDQLILVDEFSRADKKLNLAGKAYLQEVDRGNFATWIEAHHGQVGSIIHLGARTDTTEFNTNIFNHLNLGYSRMIWEACSRHGIPLIYASSAATYGLGEHGYNDTHELIPRLRPLNPYGQSKQDFDAWVLDQPVSPPRWIGLKFFNVYGPNEYHKGRMASVIFHAYNQIRAGGQVRLFRSHIPDYADGMQLRDFIYVKDVVNVILYLLDQEIESGIYNLGTGVARSFNDLALATFRALDLDPDITYVDIPGDIRDKYQYFTQAEMQKLISQGYRSAFTSLEAGVDEYVRAYLKAKSCY